MTATAQLVLALGVFLIVLSVWETWRPEVKAIL